MVVPASANVEVYKGSIYLNADAANVIHKFPSHPGLLAAPVAHWRSTIGSRG